MANMYDCSNGERITEATIQARYSRKLREWYQDNPSPRCEGCGDRASCTAHIIPRAILKQLHLADLIYSRIMVFPACFKCNMIAENVSSPKIMELKNYEQIRDVIEKYDPVRASKLPDAA